MQTHQTNTAGGRLPAKICHAQTAIGLVKRGVSNFDLRGRLEPADVDQWWVAIHKAYSQARKADPFSNLTVELRLLRDHVGEMPKPPAAGM